MYVFASKRVLFLFFLLFVFFFFKRQAEKKILFTLPFFFLFIQIFFCHCYYLVKPYSQSMQNKNTIYICISLSLFSIMLVGSIFFLNKTKKK